jgi:hypothetical integral membrane protein (TIGR02206 family)
MEWFGSSNKNYEFQMFSTSHLVMISILIFGSVWIFLYRNKLNEEKWRRAEIGIAISLIIMETAYHSWMIINDSWNVSYAIPLELCSISLILTVILLTTKARIIYEILIFTALLGASQALFTPLLNYDFPHFRFFHFFYSHLMIIWVPLYFTWAKGYRPTIWSVCKLFIFLNILMPIIMFINNLVDGNYMFFNHKPNSASLLDFLGPYPWYILSMEGLLISLSLIVWLIFREKIAKKTEVARNLTIR